MKGMKGGWLKKLKSIPSLSIKQGLVLHFSSFSKKLDDQKLLDPSLTKPVNGLDDEQTGIKLHISQKHSRTCSIASDESFTSVCSFQSVSESIESPIPSPGENERREEPDPNLSKFEKVKCPPGGENSVIFYTTSLRGIRKTLEDCTAIRFLLKSFNVKFYERDVSMDLELRNEFWNVMGGRVVPPCLFIKGQYVGGASEVIRLHEQGQLHLLLKGIRQVDTQVDQPCRNCSNIGFVLCSICNGSCKVHCEDETEELLFTRCSYCNENGLLRCHACT